MCPLCLGTATLLVSGTTSATGVALVLLRKHLPTPRTRPLPPVPAAAENPTVVPRTRSFSSMLRPYAITPDAKARD
jgi:hypothetical protein